MAEPKMTNRAAAPAAGEPAESKDRVTRLEAVRDQRRPSPEPSEADGEAVSAPDPESRAQPQRGERAPAPPLQSEAPVAAAPARAPKKRNWKRPLLFALLPIALVIGGYEYATGGRVMTTDNAYVQAESVGVSTDVSGTIIEIDVQNNDSVKKGQILFRLKPDSFRTALAAAQAQLDTVRNQVLTLQASYKQALAQIAQAQTDVPYYEATFQRQKNLVSTAVSSRATYEQAAHDLAAARQRVSVAQAQAQAVLAQLGGNADQPVEENPFYRQALAAVENAQRDLNDTVVKAPFDGVVTNVDAVQIGSYLESPHPAFSLVSSSHVWIEATPKETELTYVRPGQKAAITVDTYPGYAWTGAVDSISPASSSSFSLLPAQNTSGNWVKVVQRIPMRVKIDPAPDQPPLRMGMSAEVRIDTGHARGLPTFLTRWFGG
jgi:membrane fusion protein (multidrug efflux system)